MQIPRPNPELMVIGDSLAQGTRSLSVTPTTTAESYAAIIAASQGWQFVAPDLPRPVLFDMEAEILRAEFWMVGSAIRAFRHVDANLDAWRRDFDSADNASRAGHVCFDNLALAGASLADIFRDGATKRTSASCATFMQKHANHSLDDLMKEKDALMNMHLAINARYCLNPSGDPAFADWSQMDWVRARKPKQLIVHGGHNNGLYPIGSNAEEADLMRLTLPEYLELARHVVGLPGEIGKIWFVLLPKISAVANLAPRGGRTDPDGYYQEYAPQFSSRGKTIKGSVLKRIDSQIKEINRAARAEIKKLDTLRRIECVETYDILSKYDFKNTHDTSRQIVIGKTRLDNRYIAGKAVRIRERPGWGRDRTGWVFQHGGFQGIDGMHPTGVGYAVFAVEIMKAMGLLYDKEAILKKALAAERLLNKQAFGLIRYLQDVMKFMGNLGKS